MGVIRDRWRVFERQLVLDQLALVPSDLPSSLATDAEVATAVATLASTTATETELASAVSTINTAISAKQDATAATTALALKAPLASPAFTGAPTKNGSPVQSAADVAGAFAPLPASGKNPLTGFFHADGYGVVGNGVATDTTGLQAVLTAAGPSQGTVYIPPGTVLLDDTVYVPQGVTVKGAHSTLTTIKRANSVVVSRTNQALQGRTAVFAAGSAQYTPYTSGARGSRVTFEDLTVDGNKANNTISTSLSSQDIFAHNIAAVYVDSVHVRRCVLKNSVMNGVYTFGCTDVRVMDNEFDHCGNNVASTYARESFSFNGSSGLEATVCIASGNYIHDGVGSGVAFGGANNVRLTDNHISGCQKGIEGDAGYAGIGQADCVIEGNVIYNLSGGPAGGAVGIGVSCSDGSRALITGNTVKNVAAYGILFSQVSESAATISDNIIESFGGGYAAGASTQWHGIAVTGHRVLITANEIRDGAGAGIAVSAGRNIVTSDNIVENVKSDGVSLFLSTTAVDNIVLSGNSVFQADGRGFRIQTGGTVSKLSITGNVLGAISVSGAGKPGVVIDGASTAIKRLVVGDNIVVDERGTKYMTYGLDLSGLTTSVLSATIGDNVFYPAVTAGINGRTKVTLLAASNNIEDSGGPTTAASGIFLRSGLYYFATPGTGSTTSNTIPNGNLRLAEMVVPRQVTITNVGADISAAGDAGSTLRIGIYTDDGTGYPGALVADCGTVPADAIAQPEITGLSVVLNPGTYWVGAAVQGVTVTSPTVRCLANVMTSAGIPTKPTALAGLVGYVGTGVTGALSANFTTTVTSTGNVPRIFVKIA